MNGKSQYQRDREAKDFLDQAIAGLITTGSISWWIGIFAVNSFFVIIGTGFVIFATLLVIFLDVI